MRGNGKKIFGKGLKISGGGWINEGGHNHGTNSKVKY